MGENILVPVRCFTCGAVVADKYEIFKARVKEGADPGSVLDELDVRRYCCRRMLLTSLDFLDQVLPYHESLERKHAEFE